MIELREKRPSSIKNAVKSSYKEWLRNRRDSERASIEAVASQLVVCADEKQIIEDNDEAGKQERTWQAVAALWGEDVANALKK